MLAEDMQRVADKLELPLDIQPNHDAMGPLMIVIEALADRVLELEAKIEELTP